MEDISINGESSYHGPIMVTGVTSVELQENVIPDEYSLSQNYPNPFNPETTIHYAIPEAGHVIINIFNMQGKRIVTLVNEDKPAGTFFVKWNGCDTFGNKVTSGIYLYQIIAADFSKTQKMILMK